MTNLWQEEYGMPYYRIQTDEKRVSEKLKRRKGFKLTANGLNTGLWIFVAEFSRPDIARAVLKSITGALPQVASDGIILYDPMYSSEYNKTERPKGNDDSESTLFD